MAQQDQRLISTGVYWVDETTSTQDLAVQQEHQLRHGDVIATGHQTAGRGRLDRRWETVAGRAAAMSMVVRPDLDTKYFGTLTLVVAASLVRWLRSIGVDASVKWPNDVLAPDGKKFAGILAQWLPETRAVVVGVGTNLDLGSQTPLETAAALADYGVHFSPQEYVIAARQHFLTDLEAFAGNPDVQVLETNMATIGQNVRAIMPDGKDIVGKAIGLGPTGSLRVENETIHDVYAADIKHLRSAHRQ